MRLAYFFTRKRMRENRGAFQGMGGSMKGIKGYKSMAAFAVVLIGLLAMHGVASGAPFTAGDVFASVGIGKVKEFTPSGTFVQTLDTTTGSGDTAGSAFDNAGNFYVTSFQTNEVSKFNNNGTLAAKDFIPAGTTTHNESIVFDNSGNFYVGGADQNTIKKFNAAGTVLNSFIATVGPRGTDWVDLAADQHTIFYTSEGGSVRRFDTSTNTQLTDFTSSLGGVSYALRLLSDGGALVAHTSNVLRLNSSGAVIQTYTIPGSTTLFSLNLDPDGTTFWTGNLDSIGTVFHVRISDGVVLGQFNTVQPGDNELGGLTIFGEITQGCPTCGAGPTVPEPSTFILLGAGLLGLAGYMRHKSSGA